MSGTDSSITDLQNDWEARENIAQLMQSLKTIADFVNKFNASTHARLAQLRARVERLDQQVKMLEQKSACYE